MRPFEVFRFFYKKLKRLRFLKPTSTALHRDGWRKETICFCMLCRRWCTCWRFCALLGLPATPWYCGSSPVARTVSSRPSTSSLWRSSISSPAWSSSRSPSTWNTLTSASAPTPSARFVTNPLLYLLKFLKHQGMPPDRLLSHTLWLYLVFYIPSHLGKVFCPLNWLAR